jgi:hypothetical protein
MDHQEVLTAIALEFDIPDLTADEFGLCAIEMNGQPVFIKQSEQDGVLCVLLSAAIGTLDSCDDSTIGACLEGNLFSEGYQIGALEDGTVVLNKVISLAALSRARALHCLRCFGRCVNCWRERLSIDGASNEHA